MNDADIHELFAPAAARSLPPMSFSLDDVVRQGTSVRRRRRAGSVAAVLAVAALVVGGLVVLRPGHQAPPASTVPTLAGQRAGRAVDYALTTVPLPAGAHTASPVSGVQPNEPAPVGPSVHRIAWYATTSQPTEVARWILDHGYAAGWDEGMSYSTDQASGDLAPLGQVQNVDSPAPILQVTVRRHAGGSIIRVDGWQRPQPVVVRDAATLIGSASSVDVTRGSAGANAAYSSTLTLNLTGARVAALARALDSLPAAWARAARTCAAAESTTFTFRVATGVLVFTDQPACGWVRVSLNGKERQALTAFDLSLKSAVASLGG